MPRSAQHKFRVKERRKLRHKVHQMIREGRFDYLPDEKEYANPWFSPEDGRGWFGNLSNKEYLEELMRK